MNKFIEQQLKKCQVAKLGNYNSDTKEIIIKKFEQILIQENSYYLIELADYILNPPPNSTLATN